MSEEDTMREALERIVDPIGAMRRDAEKVGRRLEGSVAYSLSNDPNYLKGIARAAIAASTTPEPSEPGAVTQGDGPFHVSRSSDGEKNWFSARDAAAGVTIPAKDRDDAYALVASLNRSCANFARHRLTAQSGEGRSGAGEDWISHDGGDCPVDPAATVEIKLRDGSVTTMAAKAVNWRYGTYIFELHRTMPASCEVVVYRIAALNARQSGEGERLREAAAGVLAHRVDGSTRGWLRDNRDSRAALDALAAALRATDDAGGA